MAGTRPEGLAQGGMWATSQPWQTSSERPQVHVPTCHAASRGGTGGGRRGTLDTLGHLGRLHWRVCRAAPGPQITAHWTSSWATGKQSQPCPHLGLS